MQENEKCVSIVKSGEGDFGSGRSKVSNLFYYYFIKSIALKAVQLKLFKAEFSHSFLEFYILLT